MCLLLQHKVNVSFLFFRIIRFGHNKWGLLFFVLSQSGLNNGIINELF